MATHTWVDLHIPEAAKLADLGGILCDLHQAQEFAKLLASEFGAAKPNWPVEQVLAGGQKAFVVDTRAQVAKKRKR